MGISGVVSDEVGSLEEGLRPASVLAYWKAT
jgi:hypothetical protein